MRKAFLILAFLGQFSLASFANPGRQGHPVPPGMRQADKQTNAPLEAPLGVKQRAVDQGKLKEEAAELARLAAAIPPQMEHLTQGQLPKDLAEQLKRIEKLAKQLRSEIVP